MKKGLQDGWYLMSTDELERELARWRSPEGDASSPAVERLTTEQALAFRDAGNVPDERDRTLRLVLRVDDAEDLARLADRRLAFEPDFHDAPTWRREGSRPINVVPLRRPGIASVTTEAWWDDPELAALEREYQEHGTAAGVRIPGDYRGFLFKTVLALREGGRAVTPEAISSSVARWLSPEDAARVASAIEEANH